MTRLSTIGGWWRLWIVFTACWVAWLALNAEPRPSLHDQLLMAPAVSGIDEAYLYEELRLALNADFPVDRAKVISDFKLAEGEYMPPSALEKHEEQLAQTLHGDIGRGPLIDSLFLAVKSTRPDDYGRFQRLMAAEHSSAVTFWFWKHVVFGLAPPLLLIVLGQTARWIFRGFKPKSS